MTAELIVMNKNGLALAADSAVSVSAGSRTTKVYNTANKLFALSKYCPVGVMVYGSAEIMGLPWEVVIKRYREVLGPKPFTSVEQYIQDFFNYLKTDAFPSDCYAEYVKQRAIVLFSVIMEEIDTKVEAEIKEKGEIDDTEIDRLHCQCIKDTYDYIRKTQKDLKIKQIDISESLSNHRPIVSKVVNTLLENRPVKGTNKRKLIDTCLLAAVVFPGMNKSGIVIAGFGSDDIFPSAKAFEIHKILDGNIDFYPVFEGDISLNSTVNIKAFAQTNETQNFMNGMSGRIRKYIMEDVENILSSAYSKNVTKLLVEDGIVPTERCNDCEERLSHAGSGVHAFIERKIDEISKQEFSTPVIDAVAFFSPTEMASMAETLVSLESFRQQVTLSSETVGGPIDVAVITRGDGFIWIKRKHYFAPELNHQFFNNYCCSEKETLHENKDN